LICFLLPQFHRIPENDRWWGEGFTEWTNTRKARPLFEGHYQPREPHEDYYYDLTDPDARHHQAELAKEYGVYGFCYYHYWFKGKQLLERPLNDVLELGEPDLPFCLCWANEPWTKVWDGGEGGKHILMPQDYGGEGDWEEHFNYLLSAFKDERYIKRDGKPVYLIYKAAHVERCDDMLEYWDGLAKENGLNGIYAVQVLTHYKQRPRWQRFDANLEFEPTYTVSRPTDLLRKVYRKLAHKKLRLYIRELQERIGRGLERIDKAPGLVLDLHDYDEVWRQMLSRKLPKSDTFLGAFVDWDNSPRRGVGGFMMVGATPEKFGRYLKQQIARSEDLHKDGFVFINAWNEWAEGAYLEPDKKFGYQYLQAIKGAINQEKDSSFEKRDRRRQWLDG